MEESSTSDPISHQNPLSDEEASASESESISPSSSISNSRSASTPLDEREELFIDLLRYSTAFEMSSRKKNTSNSQQDATKLEKKKIDKQQETEKEAFFAKTFFNVNFNICLLDLQEFVNRKSNNKEHEDDLLFFVRKQIAKTEEAPASPKLGKKTEPQKQEDKFFVVRFFSLFILF